MKLLSTLSTLVVAASAIEYNFQNGVMVTTNKYSFASVAPGIDAVVTYTPFPGTSISLMEADATSTGSGAALQPKLQGVPQGTTEMMSVHVEFKTATGAAAEYADNFRVCFVDIDGRAPTTSAPHSGAGEIVQIIEPTPTSWSVEAETTLTVEENPLVFFGKQAVEPGINIAATSAIGCVFFSSSSYVKFNVGFQRGATNTADPWRLFSANFYEPATFDQEVDQVDDIITKPDDVPDIDEYNSPPPTAAPSMEKSLCSHPSDETVYKCSGTKCWENLEANRKKFDNVVDKDAAASCTACPTSVTTADGEFSCDDSEILYTPTDQSKTTYWPWECDCASTD